MNTNKTQPTDSLKRMVGPLCRHSDQPNMTYIDWHQDAIARRKRGEKQIFCHECGKYVWGEYWPNEPSSLTGRHKPMKAKRPSKLKRARTERAKPRSVQRVVSTRTITVEVPEEMLKECKRKLSLKANLARIECAAIDASDQIAFRVLKAAGEC